MANIDLRGVELLNDPRLNKGTAFTEAERDALGLRGLLPPRAITQAEQEARVLQNFREKPSPIEKYVYLISLQDRNEHLFYRVVMDHIEEMLPIIYTPTVGEACMKFSHLFRRHRGLYVTARDRGRIGEVLRNWPGREVGIIVVTDGERILGLGDLGANGMGIPIGKLALYTACAGLDPALCLPVTLDVGTDREEFLGDPQYLGLPQRRLRGEAYDELLEEFVTEVERAFPEAMIQFEDFATAHAIGILARYRDRICCFNDDIQGTAAVTLAGLLSAGRLTGQPLVEQRVLMLGAGAAATGIADLIVSAMVRDGLSLPDARARCWFVDMHGMLVASRTDLPDHKRPFAHDHLPVATLLEAVDAIHPTVLIGVSTAAGSFSEPVVRAMARHNRRPIIFPLSNPTSRSECSAAQAWDWSDGRAVFASGSPFEPWSRDGRTLYPAQGNNAYIFPGIGLGVLLAKASRVTDTMFYAAARTLAEGVSRESLESGRLFPRLRDIRDVSARIAVAVAETAYEAGLARAPRPADLRLAAEALMYHPGYPTYA